MADTGAHDPAAAWERLVAAVMLGTERGLVPTATGLSIVANALPEEPEAQRHLLNEAGVLWTYLLEGGGRPR